MIDVDVRTSVLAIIAGKGVLPQRIAEACRKRGEPFYVLAFRGETDESFLSTVEHRYIRHGAVGETLSFLREKGVGRIVLAGRIERPGLRDLSPDAKGAQLLGRLGKAVFAGDNKILSTITGFLEEEGFALVGAEELLEEGAAPSGVLGAVQPDAQAEEDICLGVRVAKSVGALDIGQAVIVQHGYVLGVEAVEGTDALITRCAGLKITESGGVLVKVAKPQQDERVDLPAIGVETVRNIAAAGFVGIAVEAGHALIIDRAAVTAEADKLGVFVAGVVPVMAKASIAP